MNDKTFAGHTSKEFKHIRVQYIGKSKTLLSDFYDVEDGYFSFNLGDESLLGKIFKIDKKYNIIIRYYNENHKVKQITERSCKSKVDLYII